MKKVLALIGGSIVLFQTLIATAATSPKPKSFAQWCSQRRSLPANTKYTINVLLKEAGSNNCQQADTKLRSKIEISLFNKNIVDIQPLAGFSNLTSLDLSGNKIVDIKPLAGLRKLTYLQLAGNKVVDIKPLVV
jgi:internalin A